MNILGINAFHGDASVGAGQGRQAGRRRSKKSASIGASTAPGSRRWPPSGAGRRRRRARATWTTSRCRAIRRRTCTRRSCSRSRSGRRSRSWSRTAWRTSPRSAASTTRWRRRSASRRSALRAKFHGVEHHKSHISSAFFISPFEQAACLSIDGFGDFVSTMRGVGRDRTAGDHRSDRVSPLRRAVLHGGHAVHRLPPLRRGVEDDGAGAVRQADLRRQAAAGDPPDRRRALRARPRLLPPPHRRRRDDLGRRLAPDRPGVLAQARRAARARARDPEDPDFFGKWADIAHSAQVVYEEIFFHVARATCSGGPGSTSCRSRAAAR